MDTVLEEHPLPPDTVGEPPASPLSKPPETSASSFPPTPPPTHAP